MPEFDEASELTSRVEVIRGVAVPPGADQPQKQLTHVEPSPRPSALRLSAPAMPPSVRYSSSVVGAQPAQDVGDGVAGRAGLVVAGLPLVGPCTTVHAPLGV